MMEIVPDVKACAELLKDLNLQEKGDYCKCLQLPVRDTWKKSKMSDEIAQEFHRYPEHLLYGLEEYEYEELLDWMKLPYGRCEIPEWNNMFVKVFGFGLKKRTCQELKKLSEIMASHIVEEIYSGIMNRCFLLEIMSSVEVILYKTKPCGSGKKYKKCCGRNN